jgi:hypothetical protein
LANVLAGALMYGLMFERGAKDAAADVSVDVLKLVRALGFDLAKLGLSAR